MSTARHHAEWLSLLEISGPFLSMPVLLRAFPQGLDADDPALAASLRLAYEEWLDNQQGLKPDPALHRAWVRWVLTRLLGMDDASLIEGDDLPAGLHIPVPEHGESLRPDFALLPPPDPFAPAEQTAETTRPGLLVQVMPPGQGLEKPVTGSRWQASPATRMMQLLHATQIPLGLLTNGEQWMLVHARPGQSSGFISWYAQLWLEERLTLRAFRTLLGSRRFFSVSEAESLAALLLESVNDQQEVTDQLGVQVRHAVEVLIQAMDRADRSRPGGLLAGLGEAALYEAAVTVMMRLVFLLSAEERELLPVDDPLYAQHYAVSTLREQLQAVADQYGEALLERRHDAWCRLLACFRAVHGGVHHDRLHLPAYGGSLFDPARYPFLEGRISRKAAETQRKEDALGGSALLRASPLPIDNRTVLHLLDALQLLQVAAPGGGVETRRISFRALDIEQIGHVYEGLLDHTAKRAGSTVLGLQGTAGKGDPEIPLERLESFVSRKDAEAQRRGGENLGGFAPLREDAEGNARQDAEAQREKAETLGGFAALREDGKKALIDFLREETGRSASALGNALGAEPPDLLRDQALRAACDNDEELHRRVLPFHGLLRDDTYGRPLIIPSGSLYVTGGTDRRSSGAHYTPRSLTEPIVQHTLEPLVYHGPAQGKPREQWRLRPPQAILDLKVCDMAMGSGAFLVQACRYLAERLVESIEENDARQDAKTQRKEEKNLRKSAFSAESAFYLLAEAESEEERLVLARRLVADRCLYGVDKNPLAVEMAKLSLWLITLAKGRPFTFVDHALKCGDSLVGVDMEQLRHWSLHPAQTTGQQFAMLGIELDIQAMIEKRREIEGLPVQEVADLQHKARLLAEADALAHDLKRAGDLLVTSYYNDLKSRKRETLRSALLSVARDGASLEESWQTRLPSVSSVGEDDSADLRPFHWPLEFPEVFLAPLLAQARAASLSQLTAADTLFAQSEEERRTGFDAFVGNPPFIGGQRIRGAMGEAYLNYVKTRWNHTKGSADYCAYFFLRAFEQLGSGGSLGLIATNTIAQGDTRELGLAHIAEQEGVIYRAQNNTPWPGQAAVVVNVVHIHKGSYRGEAELDGRVVKRITPLLDDMPNAGPPQKLKANENLSFQGSNVLGLGFTMTPEEAQELIARNPKNRDVLFPYLNGQDLNSHPEQQPSRWVINFFDWPRERTRRGSWWLLSEKAQKMALQEGRVPEDYPHPVAADYPDCLAIVRDKVYPQRMTQRREIRKRYWWRYGEVAPALYATIAPLERVLVLTIVSRTVAFASVPSNWVYAHRVCVFPFEDYLHFAVLQSNFHYIWAWQYSSTLKQDLNYSPTDVFQTFPFPDPQSPVSALQSLDAVYHSHRAAVMTARQEGLTSTYNRFHDPDEAAADIARLRGLHVEMDNTVAGAYGWDDLALGHGFHETAQGVRFTIHDEARREVLGRLLALNHQRYAEEVAAGLHEKKEEGKAKGKRQKAKGTKDTPDGQLGLF